MWVPIRVSPGDDGPASSVLHARALSAWKSTAVEEKAVFSGETQSEA